MTEQQSEHRRAKGRSPSYPGLSLRIAVERARVVYSREGKHPAPISTITAHWGYKSPTTGPASVTYAALLKYGLLTDEGAGAQRLAVLTPLALDIMLNPDPSASIQKAALTPAIHREMWDEFGPDLPSDDNLRYRFVAQRGFTETGAREFIREYRETLDFAQLPSGGSVGSEQLPPPPVHEDVPDDADDPPPPRKPQRRGRSVSENADVQTIAVPLLDAPPMIVEGRFPVTEAEWTYFMAVLSAMKPGLVVPAEREQCEPS